MEQLIVLYGKHVTNIPYKYQHGSALITLEKLNNIVDLGVSFDDKLSFRDHIVDKTNKCA